MKIKLLLALLLPIWTFAAFTPNELKEIQGILNQSFQQSGIEYKAMNVYVYNDRDGKTLVMHFRGKMIDTGVRSAEQIKNNVFQGMTREDVDFYKNAGYTRVKVIVLKDSAFYYLR